MNNNKWTRLGIIAILFITISQVFLIQYSTYVTYTMEMEQKQLEEQKAAEEEAKKLESVEYELSIKTIENEEETWKTYTVHVYDMRESVGIYWLNDSLTEDLVIKLKFNEDNTLDISEHTLEGIKVRYLGRFNEAIIHIKEYNDIGEELEENEQTEETESISNESN